MTETRRDVPVLGRTGVALTALTILMLMKGMFWIALCPIFQIADEPAHFDDIQFRAEHGRAPTYDNHGLRIESVMHEGAATEVRRFWYDTIAKGYYSRPHDRDRPADRELSSELERLPRTLDGRDTDGQDPAMVYPGLYYSMAVPFYRAFESASVLVRIHAIRCLSLLLGLCAVIATYFAAKLVTRDETLCFVAAVFVILQPMESQMTVAVNNDAGVLAFGAVLFYLTLRALAALPGWPTVGTLAGIGACALALFFTKPTGYGLFPVVGVAGAIVLGTHGRDRRVWIFGAGVAVLAIAVFVRGVDLSSVLPGDTASPGKIGQPDFWSFLESLKDDYMQYLVRSTWGQFGWLDFSIDTRWMTLLHTVFELMMLGTIAGLFAWSVRDPERPFWFDAGRLVFCIFTTIAGVAFILYAEHRFRLTGVYGVVQGRNFLFVLPAFAIWITVGLAALVPARLRGLGGATLVTGALVFHLAGILTIVRHHYVP